MLKWFEKEGRIYASSLSDQMFTRKKIIALTNSVTFNLETTSCCVEQPFLRSLLLAGSVKFIPSLCLLDDLLLNQYNYYSWAEMLEEAVETDLSDEIKSASSYTLDLFNL